MKHSKSEMQKKAYSLPEVKFETQALTSFAGLVLLQKFFATLQLKQRLQRCFSHLNHGKIFDRATLFVQLILHVLLGYRELKDNRYYQDDPLVQRVLGLNRLAEVAPLSRRLQEADAPSLEKLRSLLREMVLQRLPLLSPTWVALDFDGSVQSTQRKAEGTAVGFNKKKKGARSCYPLFCTLAQTGQVIDFLHRPGNVHDSNGAQSFILACREAVLGIVPHVRIKVRVDAAFFSDEMVDTLWDRGVEFTISVPFERFVELNGLFHRNLERTLDQQKRPANPVISGKIVKRTGITGETLYNGRNANHIMYLEVLIVLY